jgi:hypothetical protein
MLKNILMPAVLGATIALGGAAFADDATTAKKELYKESQTQPNAKPMEGSVKPDAKSAKKLHKNVQKDAGKAVKDKSVKADAPLDKKLYKETEKSAPITK